MSSSDSPVPAVSGWGRTLFSILAVAVVVALPLFLLRGLVQERIALKSGVQKSANESWGGPQTVTGPALEIPLTDQGMSAGRIVLLPQSLDANAELSAERRSRGLFQALIYGSKITLAGRFVAPDWAGLGISTAVLDFSRASLVVGVSDSRGIRQAELVLDGKPMDFAPIERPGFVSRGIDHTGIPISLAALEHGLPFTVTLDLAGAEELGLAPVGDQTTIRIAGNWPDPEFLGAFLPGERRVSEAGFEGSWSVSKLARNYPSAWKLADADTTSGSVVAVRVIDPVDIYAQTDRLLKYGLVVIALAFGAIGIGAAMLRAMPHPFEWLMAGWAVALSFLLTLALSEHLGFGFGYLIACAVEVAMVTFYLGGAVARRLGFGVGITLALVHGFIYVVLGSERYALLAGSLGLTLALAVAMALTRGLDWDRLAPLRGRKHRASAAEPG
jgi:inner membrane protein